MTKKKWYHKILQLITGSAIIVWIVYLLALGVSKLFDFLR